VLWRKKTVFVRRSHSHQEEVKLLPICSSPKNVTLTLKSIKKLQRQLTKLWCAIFISVWINPGWQRFFLKLFHDLYTQLGSPKRWRRMKPKLLICCKEKGKTTILLAICRRNSLVTRRITAFMHLCTQVREDCNQTTHVAWSFRGHFIS